jgi:muramoyltetrapeptide carboxypeptidase
MIKPAHLEPGDTIYILSTARAASVEEVQPFIDWLKSRGFRVITGETIGSRLHQFAGDDELRARDFNAALRNPDVKVIWCARGGYGSIRMLDMIDTELIRQNPKWLTGFSDVTALHALFQREGVMSLHAFMAVQFNTTLPEVRENTLKMLKGEDTEIPEYDTTEILKGRIYGGNLSILYSINGSDLLPSPTEPAILFIEEIDEYLYHIDRMLWAFRRSGWLSRFSAIVVGGMTDMNDHEIPFGWSAEEIIRFHADALKIPVVFNFPCGHVARNEPLMLGGQVG